MSSYIEDDGRVFYSNTGWTSYYEWAPYMSPTHWMPLPKEPDEGDDFKVALGKHDFPISKKCTTTESF